MASSSTASSGIATLEAFDRQFAATRDEIEAVRGLHAAIFFLGVREHAFGLDVPSAADLVAVKVRAFLHGVPAVLAV